MTSRHCLPDALWRAARENLLHDQATLDHLAVCDDCSTLWTVIRQFPHARTAQIDHAPSGWIERAVAIARKKSVAGRLVKLVAELRFDSWVTSSPVILRGASGERSRRLSWQVGSWTIDLRAEGTTSGWNCTAQVQEGGQPRSSVEIKSGSLQVRTDDAGLATWTASRPPRILHVSDAGRSVQLGPLSWQPPKRN